MNKKKLKNKINIEVKSNKKVVKQRKTGKWKRFRLQGMHLFLTYSQYKQE